MYRTANELNVGDTVIIFGVNGPKHNAYGTTKGVVENQSIIWRVIAKDKYAPNTVTLLGSVRELANFQTAIPGNMFPYETWIGSTLQLKCESFYENLPNGIKDVIVPVSLYNDFEMNYGPPERVSVLSLNEVYSRAQFEEHFKGKNDIIAHYNDEAYMGYIEFDVEDFWTRTPSYEDYDNIKNAYTFGAEFDGKNLTTTTQSSGAWPIRQDYSAFFRPFFTVTGDAYITAEKFYGHYIMYGVSEEELFGYVKMNGVQKKLYGTKSFKTREWN